jgi:glucose repression regulatory protein TUP1
MRGSLFFVLFVLGLVADLFSVLFFFYPSVVCCVRFSADGKYLATGCNRTAQIYDTKTGQKTWSVFFLLFCAFSLFIFLGSRY